MNSSSSYIKKAYIIVFMILSHYLCASGFTIVIDAGHGGKDIGAVGRTSNEKDINLAVAMQLGDMIKESGKNINVIYTRDNDTFISLHERAAVANNAKADLFISIHCNSVAKKNKNRNIINGASTYVLGLQKSMENLEVAMRENAVIEQESDYTQNYKGFDPNSTESYIIFEISQQQHLSNSILFAKEVQNQLSAIAGRKDSGVRQALFLLLHATGMPAALIELDFLCNPDVEKYLNSKKGQKDMALSIYNAVLAYKQTIDARENTINELQKLNKQANDDTDDEVTPAKLTQNEVKYEILIAYSKSDLMKKKKRFKNINDIKVHNINGIFYYTVGEYHSIDEANKAVATLGDNRNPKIVIINDNNIEYIEQRK